MTRIIDFTDGFTNASAPSIAGLTSSGFTSYANDAAFVAAEGTAQNGDSYYNTTLDQVRVYTGGAWTSQVTEDDVQLVINKKLSDSTSTIVDNVDNTKVAKFEASGITTGTTRTMTIPDADFTFVGVDTAQTLTNKTFTDSTTYIQDNADNTKKVQFQVSGVTTATTRTLTVPDADTTLVGTDATQVITNKDIDGGTAANTRRITVPKDTKSNLDALTRKAGTIVFATDSQKFYGDNGSVLGSMGGGVGGVNFLALDTSWGVNKQDNSDLETSIGDWTTYNDSAAIPVDLTGGTASQLTLSRTTTAGEVLDGTASLKLVKSAANAQGQGAVCSLNVPPAYQGKQCVISIPFKVSSGSIVSGDVYVYIYDSTNSQLITPFNNAIVGSQGTLTALFSPASPAGTPANQALRLGIHFASTSATAVTLLFDDIRVFPADVPTAHGAVGDWGTDVVITPTNFGTVTNSTIKTRRVGDSLEVQGFFNVGTPSASPGTLDLPSGLTIDTSKISSATNGQHVGFGVKETNGALGVDAGNMQAIFYDGSTTNKVFVTDNVVTNAFVKTNASSIFSSGQGFSFSYRIPIAQWTSNVTLSGSSSFYISSVLANGTRVTSTPTTLGQYRCLIRDASARTFSDTTTSAAPSITDGMKYFSVSGTSAGTAGQPNRWVIFIGKNKNYRMEFYSSAGKTGNLATDFYYDGTTEQGTDYFYDPTTGCVTVTLRIQNIASVEHNVGVSSSSDTASLNSASLGYFDIKVSENTLAIGVERPRSQVDVITANGHGSSNTCIRRFSTTNLNTGSAITYADSSTLGASFTINEDGLYYVGYWDRDSATIAYFGISVNGSALSTTIADQTYAQGKRAVTVNPSGDTGFVSWVGKLSKGDIVRPHTNGTINGTGTNRVGMTVTKISD